MKNKINGFMVCLGDKSKKCFTFKYAKTKKEVENIKTEFKTHPFFKLSKQDEIWVKPIQLNKCNNAYCNELTEDIYCLKCEKIMSDVY